MGSVSNCQKEIPACHAIRWFKCKLKPPKNQLQVLGMLYFVIYAQYMLQQLAMGIVFIQQFGYVLQ